MAKADAPLNEFPLEPSGEEMKRMVSLAMRRIVEHLESLPEQPPTNLEGAFRLARSLVEPLPEEGAPYTELLALLFDRAIPKSFNTASPGYLAYIPGGGLFHAAVADLIANSVNRYTGLFASAPALVQLETNVLRWFAALAGYPETARGLLVSGGSLANLVAVITVRRVRLPENFLEGVLYASDQTHHSVAKAALLAGFPSARMRTLPSDGQGRMRLDLLAEAVAADREAGLTPFFVVANAGTTNTGAVDPLADLADFCAREKLWLHVDAAYGGFFLLTEDGRARLRSIERADSIVLDPHKGLFLPYGTGALLVREGDALRRAHSLSAEYLPDMQQDPDLWDFCEMSPELSRPYRGLSAWLPLKLHGARVFRAALEEKLALARHAAVEIAGIPGLELVNEPELSLFAFRMTMEGMEGEAADRINRRLIERINGRRRVFLTGTVFGGRFVLRLCVLSFRTHRDRLEMALADIRAAVAEVRAELAPEATGSSSPRS
jgi:aromatic-L-amino-acid/L-tryptophan decarboxylase